MLHMKNGSLSIKGGQMPYIRFGTGEKQLIMLPGLGDGLTSVQGKALPMALIYRSLAKTYRVWMFSRRLPLPEGASTADMAALTKPKSYDSFLIQGEACLHHNAADKLAHIQAPTLIMGGEQDLALGCEASRQMAQQIPNSKLLVYPQWGHGLYEEEPAFLKEICSFLQD